MGNRIDSPFAVRPHSARDGGGFAFSCPESAGCTSGAETVEEALVNGEDALKSSIAALKAQQSPVPAANGIGVAPRRFVARDPKAVHARLTLHAWEEGVSLNTLVRASAGKSEGSVKALNCIDWNAPEES